MVLVFRGEDAVRRVRSVVGAMIPPYLDLVHLAVEAGAALPASQSAALREAVSSAVAWRTQLAWRPMPARGLELALGYGLVVIFGDVTPGLAYSVANVPSSVRVSPPPVPYGVTAWLHQADVEAAWRRAEAAALDDMAGFAPMMEILAAVHVRSHVRLFMN